jgi:outer membrane protein TolC
VPNGEMLGVEPLSKDQYNISTEVIQPLTDLKTISHRKRIIEQNGRVEQLNLKVELYQIRQRVSDLFFGILLYEKQLEQTLLTRKNIELGLGSAKSAVKYGTMLRSQVDILEAEMLSIDQRIISIRDSKESFMEILSRFTGVDLDENTRLMVPESFNLDTTVNRPELMLFDAQLESQRLQSELIGIKNIPNLSLFIQGGFGRPALNFLSNDFDPYYLGGLRLSWNISNFYTSNRQKEIFAINEQIIGNKRETFLFNTDLLMVHQNSSISRLQDLIEKDKEIIGLRQRVSESSQNQLSNGVISANDYKQVVIDEDQARQTMAIHQIELLKAQNEFRIITGN